MGLVEIKNGAIEALEATGTTVNVNLLPSAAASKDVDGILTRLDLLAVKYSSTDFIVDLGTQSIQKGVQYRTIINYVKGLGPTSFEKLAARMVQLFGFTTSYATKKSVDQGIDFIGTRESDHYKSERLEMIVGQCKNYKKGDVKVNEVRELAGSLLLLKHREFSNAVNSYSQFTFRSFSSITGAFFSSYYFSNDSLELCQKSDIIPFDILDIVFLIDAAFKQKQFELDNAGSLNDVKLNSLHRNIPVCN